MNSFAQVMKAESGPTPEALIAEAEALIPVLRERAAAGVERRQVADETIAELKERGFFRVLQPRRWGGFEMSPEVLCKIAITLARGDMSVGWVYGVVAVHAWQLGVMDDRAAQEVWGSDTGVLISSSYMPGGKAERVEGGYRLTGRWGYSSGSKHCDWVFLGGLVQDGDGPPRPLTFLLPRSDYAIEDTWDTGGLRATGSNDVVVTDVFVPAYRTHDRMDGFHLTNPGNPLNDAALFHMPYGQIFVRAVSTASIGGLQGMIDQAVETAQTRVNVWGGKAKEDPALALALAEAKYVVDETTLFLERNFATLMDYAERREAPPVPLRVQYRFQSSIVPDRALTAAQRLFKAVGGAGVYNKNPFSRMLADLTIARQHAANQYEVFGRNWGKVMVGGENADYFL